MNVHSPGPDKKGLQKKPKADMDKEEISKIDRIRRAAVSLISERGAGNASVQMIARRAGVSVGYLYRHYQSKEELVGELLERVVQEINDRLEKLLEEKNSIEDIVRGFVGFVFDSTLERPERTKFVIMLQNDFSRETDARIKDRLGELCDRVLTVCRRSAEGERDMTAAELYVSLVGIPMQYAALAFKGVFGEGFTDPVREKMIAHSLRAIGACPRTTDADLRKKR